MSRFFARLGAVLLACLCAISAFAGEGRIPIYQVPTTITASGKYVLTRNLGPGSGGSTLIDVQASDVEIDLNGFVLTFGNSSGVAIRVADQSSVVVRNGAIRSGKVFVTDSERVVIEDLLIKGSPQEGILFDNVSNFTIRGVHVVGAGAAGILIDNSDGNYSEGLIERNQIESCGHGMRIQKGGSIEILHNRVDRTRSYYAIYLRDSRACILAENTIYRAARDGIRLDYSRSCRLIGNIVHDVDDSGIVLNSSHHSLVVDNVVNASDDHGIRVNGLRNQVDRNLLTENHGTGLFFDASAEHCTYGRNSSSGNGNDFRDTGTDNKSFGDNFLPDGPQ